MYPEVVPDRRFWCDGVWLEPNDQLLISFVRETSRLDTTPGLPWVGLGCATVEEVLGKYPAKLCDAVRERMKLRLSYTLDEMKALTPEETVLNGLRDVVRVFIKQEPHSSKKFKTRRFRPIMNSSLTDIVCDRLVLEALANKEVDQWSTIPSKPGMGLDDASIEKLRANIPKGVVSSDAKAFDFHVSEWSMAAAAEVEVMQYGAVGDHAHLIRASVVTTCRKVWALANGKLYAQVDAGIQESGSRMTACRNSKIRVILALLAGAEWCCAMGDDALEYWPQGFDAQRYEALGHTVEVPVLPSGVEYEFCSTHFLEAGPAVPQSWPKTLYRLLGHAPDQFLFMQFKYEMRNHPRLGEFISLLREIWLKE